jgi:hypothetical protein
MSVVGWSARSDRSGRGGGRSGSPNRLLLDVDGPASSVKSPPGPRDDRWWSTVWPMHGPPDPRTVARTLLIPGYRLGLERKLCRLALWRFICVTTPGSRPRLAGPPWPAACNDRPRMNQLTVARARAAQVSVDLLLTCDVPAVDLSCTSRDGTDAGEVKKTRYLRSRDR